MAGDGVVTSKPWYRSKTVWFNALSTVFLVAEQIRPFIPLDPVTVGTVITVGNIILRRFTNQGITATPLPPAS